MSPNAIFVPLASVIVLTVVEKAPKPIPPTINPTGPAPSMAGTICISSGGFAFKKTSGLSYFLSGFLGSTKY